MTLGTILVFSALAASLYLLVRSAARAWAVGATVACVLQVAIVLGWASLHIAHVPLPLFISVAIAVSGISVFLRAGAKGEVAAATVVAFAGIVTRLMRACRLARQLRSASSPNGFCRK